MGLFVDWILWLLTLALCGGCGLFGYLMGRESGRRSAQSAQGWREVPPSPSYAAVPARRPAAVTGTRVYGVTDAAVGRVALERKMDA